MTEEQRTQNDQAPQAGAEMKDFSLGKPALVCRWRIWNQSLPMMNRHMRALGAREVNGAPLSQSLLQWAKSHLEWTLTDGSAGYPKGVLMIIVDEEGRAAMTVGPYEPLPETTTRALAQRSLVSRAEQAQTNVAPESIWAVLDDGSLLWGAVPGESASGTTSLVVDLARTLGMPVTRVADLAEGLLAGRVHAAEVFLVSDEHGIVPAADATGPRSVGFQRGYERLLDQTKAK